MWAGDDIITPAQCRAARALINMKQDTLSELTDLSRFTINRFECGKRKPSLENLVAIRAALEVEGVIFLNRDKCGPGVRLRDRDLY